MNINNIFISYSWDSETHKNWTKMLADKLEEFFEIHVTLDQYDLDSFSDKNHFMEKGVFENDIVLVVITRNYVEKANSRVGGVGIETKMSSARHWEESLKEGSSKIIPILREKYNLPNYLKEKFYINFCEDSSFEESFEKLIAHIKGNSKSPRPE